MSPPPFVLFPFRLCFIQHVHFYLFKGTFPLKDLGSRETTAAFIPRASPCLIFSCTWLGRSEGNDGKIAIMRKYGLITRGAKHVKKLGSHQPNCTILLVFKENPILFIQLFNYISCKFYLLTLWWWLLNSTYIHFWVFKKNHILF